jgi:hypothetical protein
LSNPLHVMEDRLFKPVSALFMQSDDLTHEAPNLTSFHGSANFLNIQLVSHSAVEFNFHRCEFPHLGPGFVCQSIALRVSRRWVMLSIVMFSEMPMYLMLHRMAFTIFIFVRVGNYLSGICYSWWWPFEEQSGEFRDKSLIPEFILSRNKWLVPEFVTCLGISDLSRNKWLVPEFVTCLGITDLSRNKRLVPE